VAAAAVVTFAGLAGPAAADPRDRERDLVIGADLSTNTLMVIGLIGDQGTVGAVGLTAYALGGPIVHARYRRWTEAGQSLGLRVAAPALLAVLGCTTFGAWKGGLGGDPDDACLIGGLAGAALGIIGAELYDWQVLSIADDDAPWPEAHLLNFGGSF